MEYFMGKNLAEVLSDISSSEVRSIISQIASGALFLEEASFAHREHQARKYWNFSGHEVR